MVTTPRACAAALSLLLAVAGAQAATYNLDATNNLSCALASQPFASLGGTQLGVAFSPQEDAALTALDLAVDTARTKPAVCNLSVILSKYDPAANATVGLPIASKLYRLPLPKEGAKGWARVELNPHVFQVEARQRYILRYTCVQKSEAWLHRCSPAATVKGAGLAPIGRTGQVVYTGPFNGPKSWQPSTTAHGVRLTATSLPLAPPSRYELDNTDNGAASLGAGLDLSPTAWAGVAFEAIAPSSLRAVLVPLDLGFDQIERGDQSVDAAVALFPLDAWTLQVTGPAIATSSSFGVALAGFSQLELDLNPLTFRVEAGKAYALVLQPLRGTELRWWSTDAAPEGGDAYAYLGSVRTANAGQTWATWSRRLGVRLLGSAQPPVPPSPFWLDNARQGGCGLTMSRAPTVLDGRNRRGVVFKPLVPLALTSISWGLSPLLNRGNDCNMHVALWAANPTTLLPRGLPLATASGQADDLSPFEGAFHTVGSLDRFVLKPDTPYALTWYCASDTNAAWLRCRTPRALDGPAFDFLTALESADGINWRWSLDQPSLVIKAAPRAQA